MSRASRVQRSSGSVAKPLVSVITPTIPERRGLLQECVASVRAQLFPDWEHLILCDDEHSGCATTVNDLARAAAGDWLFILADDDMLLPGCLREHLRVGGDIVYSPPLVWGEDAAQFHGSPPAIPSASLIRMSLWRSLGGYNTDLARAEDREFYERADREQAVFTRVDHPCWVYRFHGANKSRSNP